MRVLLYMRVLRYCYLRVPIFCRCLDRARTSDSRARISFSLGFMFLDVNQLLIFSSKFIADWKQNSAGEIFMSFILIFLLFSAHKLFKTPYFPYFRRRNPYFRRKIMRKIANFRLFPLISLFPEENRQLSLISTNFAKDPPTPGGVQFYH